LDQVVIHRDEPALLMGDPAPKPDIHGQPHDDMPEQLAAFDHDAAEGERLDPNNAYFSLMRAVGLFAANRDDEALAAISRAGQKTSWIEYWNDELDSEWQMQETAFGQASALARADRWGAILYPHLRSVRAASRLAIFKAAEAEQAGRIEE